MDILEVQNLKKQFGNFTAVNGISFTLKEGEILGVLGPNGAGKTTTIQMLLGLLTPTGGDIHYFGKSLQKHKSEILEQVNFSSTYTNLPWRLTVKDCLTFVSYLYGIKNRKERIKKIVETFRLEELLKKEISSLSAGQQTRVNLAKSFLNYPKVLLLDEPTASLDPEVAAYIREFLLEERKKFNVSIIITSHNMAEVEEICDRVLFINHGTIIANDTPENLAGSIEVSHIELLFKNNLAKVEEFLKEKKLEYTKNGKYLRVTVKEKEIAQFLRKLGENNFHFEEISIEKPNLEDYFLAMAKGKEQTHEDKLLHI